MTKTQGRSSCEGEHDFTLVLDGTIDFDDDVMDKLFEAGCDDATPSLRFGRVFLTFSRPADSLKRAILSAIRDVNRAKIGAKVARVDDCQLVTQSEIARRSNRTKSIISQYASGKRGPGGFPPPACEIADGHPLYRWCEVAYWLHSHDMIKEQNLVDARDIELINVLLEYTQQRQSDPAEVDEILTYLDDPVTTNQPV